MIGCIWAMFFREILQVARFRFQERSTYAFWAFWGSPFGSARPPTINLLLSFAFGNGVDTLPLWAAPPDDPSSRSEENVKLRDVRSH